MDKNYFVMEKNNFGMADVGHGRQQGFLTKLLQRTFTKFFNRHGLIVVKYGATLREMRFAIQA